MPLFYDLGVEQIALPIEIVISIIEWNLIVLYNCSLWLEKMQFVGETSSDFSINDVEMLGRISVLIACLNWQSII